MSSTKNSSFKIHEKYHSKTKVFRKVIKDNNFTYRHLLSAINFYIKPYPLKILDIGSGAGSLSIYLASKGNKVLGIDISKKAVVVGIQSARELGLKNVKFKKMQFPEEIKTNTKFDMILFTEVIEHLKDDALAIKKINRLLKTEGLLIISTPSITAPLHRLHLTQRFDKEVGHLRRYSLTQLKNILKSNGFKILEIKKTEGIIRNFLFINPIAGKLLKYVNFFASTPVTYIDNISLKLFGESNFIIVAKKKHKKMIK